VIHALPVIVVVIALGGSFLWQKARGPSAYRCEACGATFPLSPLQATLAPHSMARKLVRCPSCGARSWASPA
jgi:DNA-directed RNA polymerase subunit RPC12/RpoP